MQSKKLCGFTILIIIFKISGTDAAPPADHSQVDGSCSHILVEDFHHLTHPLLIHNIGVGPPVQAAVHVDT